MAPGRLGRACGIALVAVLFAYSTPEVFGQARGGGRLGRDSTQSATGGGGLGAQAEEAAKGGGGMKDSEGAGAVAGGGLGDGASGAAAKTGGGLGAQEERQDDEEKGPGGALGGGLGSSRTGGAMDKGPETSPLKYLATWIPAIGAVILVLTAWYLRYVKGKRV